MALDDSNYQEDAVEAWAVGKREVLTAHRTYYVRKDGSDSNRGLSNTSGGAFLTIQHAVDVAAGLDTGIYTVTIQVGAGKYSESVILKAPTGGGEAVLQGDISTPANVEIDSGSGVPIHYANSPFTWTVRGFRLTCSSVCINAVGSVLNWREIEFNGTGSSHVQAFSGATVTASGNYTIRASATRHLRVTDGAGCFVQGRTVTLTGTPAFASGFASASTLGSITIASNTYSGSATGPRYSASGNAVINTGGAGANALPGDSSGSVATGGQYL